MKRLLPFSVYEVMDEGVRLGLSAEPLYELRCAFKTRELAEDFINYQATISKKKYEVTEWK